MEDLTPKAELLLKEIIDEKVDHFYSHPGNHDSI